MARPRLVLSSKQVGEHFEASGSIRGAAKGKKVARSVAQRSLKQNGYELPDREEGYRRQRLLATETPTKSNVIYVENWGRGKAGDIGVSTVTKTAETAVTLCIVDCTEEATHGRVCGRHKAMLEHPAKGKCAWPRCPQDATMGDPCCYTHMKRLRGEIE